MMPVMDGIEACRRLKADPATEAIPVILVSALDREEDVVRGLAAGADDYITKPFHSLIVAARVRAAVRVKAFADEAETLVRSRTAELVAANELLLAQVAERRRAELALGESEHRFRFLADAMPQIIWTARADGYVDYYNRRWYEFTGLPEGLGGDPSWEPILHPVDVARCKDAWYESVRSGSPYQIEYRFLDRLTGSYRWHLGRALPSRDEAGRVVRWVGTSTDIDDQKRAEEALKRKRDELEDRVRDRTTELEAANTGLEQEIIERTPRGGRSPRTPAAHRRRGRGQSLDPLSL